MKHQAKPHFPQCSPGALAYLARQSVTVSGVSVTQSELAEALGVSTRTIERWAAAGMPVLEQRAAQGRPRYNLAQCRKWAAERPTQGRHKPARAKGTPELGPRALEDPEKVELTPAERLTKARATDLEIKLHQRRGNILTKSEVETEWTRQGRAVRAAMLEVPAEVAIRYPGVEGLEDTCRHLIIDAMKHLAAGYKARQA